jgi:hypothetical protein
MANTYELTYTLKLKVMATAKSEAKIICDQRLDELPTNDDKVFEFTAEEEGIEMIEDEEDDINGIKT